MAINKTTQYTTDPNTIPVGTSTGSQTIVDALEQRGPVFDTVADMVAAPDLTVGIKCRTLGYNSVGDGGGNDYEIVAAATGIDDGGSFIDLIGSGLQAKGLFLDGIAYAAQFGADPTGVADSTSNIQSISDYVATFSIPATPTVYGGFKVVDFQGGTYKTTSPIVLSSINNVIFRNGRFLAETPGSWVAGDAIWETTSGSDARHLVFESIICDGAETVNLIEALGNQIQIIKCSGQHFPDFGFWMGGSQGQVDWCQLNQWNNSDPEWLGSEANHTADCVVVDHLDVKIRNNIFSGCLRPIRITTNAGYTLVEGNHVFNGPGGTGSFTGERTNIRIEANHCVISGNYIDNGYIDLTSFNNHIIGNTFLLANSKIPNDAFIRFIATGTNQVIGAISIGQNIGPNFGTWDWIKYDETSGTFLNKPLVDSLGSDRANFIGTGGELRVIRFDNSRPVISEFESSGSEGYLRVKDNASGFSGVDYGTVGDNASIRTNGIERFNIGVDVTEFGSSTTVGVQTSLDNLVNSGGPSRRWKEIFAGNGIINTSDQREKQQFTSLSEAELATASQLKGLIKKFKWNDAVEKKGSDNARWHFGVIAQEVEQAFFEHGLDGFEYGVLCYDEWDAEYDKDGNLVKDSGNRYGVRPDELLYFIISSL